MGQLEAKNQGMMLRNSLLFDYFVDQGHITLPVNHPYRRPVHGTVPSWGKEHIDGTPREQSISLLASSILPNWEICPLPPYDYTRPAGCDYFGNPSYRYIPLEHKHDALYTGYTDSLPTFMVVGNPMALPCMRTGPRSSLITL